MAVPVSFTDSFEYAEGVSDTDYIANWSTISGESRHPIVTRIEDEGAGINGGALDGTRVASAQVGTGYGISHGLGPVEPTDASPLVVEASYHHMGGRSSKNGFSSFYLEMSQGDFHAPEYGVSLPEPVPVIALVSGYGVPDSQWRFFNGQIWTGFPASVVAGQKNWNWNFITFTFTDNGDPATQTGKDLHVHVENNDPNPDVRVVGDKDYYLEMAAGAFTGGEWFDTVSIRSLAGATHESMVDRVAVHGGEIIPEPATLFLLGFACLFLRRRGW